MVPISGFTYSTGSEIFVTSWALAEHTAASNATVKYFFIVLIYQFTDMFTPSLKLSNSSRQVFVCSSQVFFERLSALPLATASTFTGFAGSKIRITFTVLAGLFTVKVYCLPFVCSSYTRAA